MQHQDCPSQKTALEIHSELQNLLVAVRLRWLSVPEMQQHLQKMQQSQISQKE